MQWFDGPIQGWMQQFVGHWPWFDAFILHLATTTDLRTLPFAIVLVGLWWAKPQDPHHRERWVNLCLTVAVAVGYTLILSHILPFRMRPYVDPALHWIQVAGGTPDLLVRNSFPSDHATMFVGIGVAMWWLSRPWGVAMTIYAVVFVCLPRVYLGVHFPTDVLAGGLIGAGVAVAGMLILERLPVGKWVVAFEASRPWLFYPVFFLVCLEIEDMFATIRAAAVLVSSLFLR